MATESYLYHAKLRATGEEVHAHAELLPDSRYRYFRVFLLRDRGSGSRWYRVFREELTFTGTIPPPPAEYLMTDGSFRPYGDVPTYVEESPS